MALSQVDRPDLIGPVDVGFRFAPEGALTLGGGPLSRVSVPGSQRLVLCGRSPLWHGFYVSTVGSAAGPLAGLGVDVVILTGRAKTLSALVLGRRNGALSVRLVPLPVPDVFSGERRGTYGLLDHLRRDADLDHEDARILAAGPGARTTPFGALASSSARAAAEGLIDTWAGRGGFGSKLVRDHGLLALVFDAPPPLVETTAPSREMVEATRKYRYHPLLQTGGTLGANLTTLREKLLAFNARSVTLPQPVRERLYEELVVQGYLRQHNAELKKSGASRDCGETCPAVCKKVSDGAQGKVKKDYQPYAALGPNIGVFDQRQAERVNELCDALGFDSIEAGGAAGLAMELAQDGVSLEAGPALEISFDPETFAPQDSTVNATAACQVLERLASGEHPLSRGIRALAERDGAVAARALYVANGEAGAVSPNQYWSPGILAPVAISGKYYVDYALDFRPPRELGRSCAARFVRELAMDNLGLCRFQREWAEERLGELSGRPQEEIDLHHRLLARDLDHAASPRPFATPRVRQHLHEYLKEARRDGPPDAALDGLLQGFERDPLGAARSYWDALRQGIVEGLA